MPNYHRILVAVDLTEEATPVLERAAGMARQHQAELHLIHVVEPLSLAYGGDIPMDFSGIQEQLQEQAEQRMAEFGELYNIAKDNRHLMVGRPESQIHELCEQYQIDLVIVGSHGRKGLALLLGSTANAVLHGSQCDVLAVRVGSQ
ncbi:universal stress protein [Spongiibacter sp. KMU-158]|uniref:Universal stress protein n=1 Tax=Spongiibacter pelagi TaxID=2760804 RepID=A0A927BZL8_9GAMM|nr:universal stress protein [Spongiibacter pelagi]MBD2858524.1 universal stress protein [Spongiibacter pelagi]